MSMLASTSRARLPAAAPALRRTAFNAHATPTEGKMELIRASLYPKDGVAPTSASPIGARHADYERRIRAAAPSAEAHETIERAWNLFRRDARAARAAAIGAKYSAMVDACAELDALTRGPGGVGDGALPRAVYDRAMVRMAHASAAYAAAKQGIAQGKKKTTESRWLEARPEGIVPREAWVPVESRGKGWNYEWTRPLNEW
jgi:large subunit ribosomal protein L40